MRAGEEATSPRLGRCPRGVPSPPFQAQARTAAGEGGGGTEGGTPIHRRTEQEVEDSLGVRNCQNARACHAEGGLSKVPMSLGRLEPPECSRRP